jgi:hypothetical protein
MTQPHSPLPERHWSQFHRDPVSPIGISAGQSTPTIEGWKTDLRELSQIAQPPGGKAYGGRGQLLPVAQAVSGPIAYLEKANGIVTSYVSALGPNAAAELADPVKLKAHCGAIQSQLAKAYPDYAMPDLIGYSVYGLATSKLLASR